ncbi:DUF421 domain-containing protein [Eubacteriales bacterium OttesenSCG-928-M02]|nr:DUF421 domain-containing protein [Eubacteriales bacterium OttesenSCG-928-M02]
MLVPFIRAAILYLVVVAFIRLMGKRQISQMQPFEVVITILMADLMAAPIGDMGIPLVDGIIPVFALLILHNVIDFLCLKSKWIRRLVCGKPSVIIEDGVLNRKELNRLSINMSDLMENLRSQKVTRVEDVKYCIIETNGEISVILKGNATPASARDAKVKVTDPSMTYTIIYEGKPDKQNMALMQVTEELLNKNLNKLGVKDIKEVYVAMLNGEDQLFLQTKTADRAYMATLKRVGIA